ncbi:MAG TPA: hypothetical protein PLC15_00465 [Candidatus Obscuribacter sp.]|nr:hypothetical protein [Candidatus Obscuribacter sp.]HNB13814.1 hypothetical protein [Candidatus Obscuribacter sp.]HND04638.1 hypothetical protein [Candidatus Obscuribacter sp.]HND66399.1 hypothetical protein [Candidatus Obscuribacter sp.]HNG73320.1 hypothetical protein [Candidatus Obscuribacter sp.]
MANFDEPQKVKPELETERSPLNLADLSINMPGSISHGRDLVSGSDAGKALPGLMLVENAGAETHGDGRRVPNADGSEKFNFLPTEDPDSKWYLDGLAKPGKYLGDSETLHDKEFVAGGGKAPDTAAPAHKPGGSDYQDNGVRAGKVDSADSDSPWYSDGTASGKYRFGDRNTALD